MHDSRLPPAGNALGQNASGPTLDTAAASDSSERLASMAPRFVLIVNPSAATLSDGLPSGPHQFHAHAKAHSARKGKGIRCAERTVAQAKASEISCATDGRRWE